jgi:hypothetical protein
MDLVKFKYAMVSVYVISQFITPASESLGGLSGNDSIARACLASLDASSGLLIVWAALNYITNCKSGWFHLPRFQYLHTVHLDEFRATQLHLSSRTSWKSFFSTSTRVAKLYRIEVQCSRLNVGSRLLTAYSVTMKQTKKRKWNSDSA